PEGAPITLHVFVDHPCVGCGALAPDLERLRRGFGDELQVVYRAYPLAIHPSAVRAAEARLATFDAGGETAHAAYLAALRTAPPSLDDAALVALAAAVDPALEAPVAAALADGRFRGRVGADRREAERLGLRVTPSFVVGRAVLPYGAGFRELEEAADLAFEDAKP
ncbi:MAG: thioredoxin domain-containing protein, partial [Myxococcota bacterium]